MENLQDYKTELPKLEWPQNKKYQWFSVDKDGRGYFYFEKPSIRHDTWGCEGPFVSCSYFPSLAADWKNSLTQRPE